MTIPCTLNDHIEKTRTLTIKQCQEVVTWWANELCLTNWAIDFKIASPREMGDDRGACIFTLSMNRATILLLDPCNRCKEDDAYDMEQTIVHELMHLHLAAWSEHSNFGMSKKETPFVEQICMEQPVERLAWVFVTMRRDNPKHRFAWERSRGRK